MKLFHKKAAVSLVFLLVAAGGAGIFVWRQVEPMMPATLFSGGGADENSDAVKALMAAVESLRPLHKKLGRPRPGEWLAVHEEPGQTFREYLRSRPMTPRGKRNTVYIQPLGDFPPAQRKIVDLTADFMGRFYGLPVKTSEELPLSVIPDRARRVHPGWGDKQILTTYVLDDVLRPRLPRDAAAYLALTPSDLWPGRGWNFVFGQASLRERVGVWSLYRNGDPGGRPAESRLCLLRTLKTATHETGHMFSMFHCTAYECGMCGSNSRPESDRRPVWFCPECVAKVCWATGADALERYRRLAAFCDENGLEAERVHYERSIATLEADSVQ
jgi:archaemetzincin